MARNPREVSETQKRGISQDMLQQWLYKEVGELSEKHDRLEKMVEEIAKKENK